MEKTERQLLLAALGEYVVLPPGIGEKTAQATGALLLQILRAEREGTRRTKEEREGEVDDPRF